jgi:tyrosine-protein kinase Etk/Wzc
MDNQSAVMGNVSQADDEIDLKSLFNLLKVNYLWLIVGAGIGLLLGLIVAITRVPSYQSSGLVQVNDQLSSQSVLGSLGSFGMGGVSRATPSQVQQVLMTSRYILTPVVKELGLQITASPKYFPLFGPFYAHHHSKKLHSPVLGLNSYSWGGEHIHVASLTVDRSVFDHRPLLLVAGKKQHYRLYDLDKHLILSGQVGSIAASQQYPGTSILVTGLVANPGADFYVRLGSVAEEVKQLQNLISISDLSTGSKSYGVDTGILKVQLNSPDQAELPIVLNAIMNTTVAKNIEQKSTEAKQSLIFIRAQLPQIKKSLSLAEQNLNNFRAAHKLIDVDAQGKAVIVRVGAIQQKIEEDKIKKVQLLRLFTPRHPIILALNDNIHILMRMLQQAHANINHMPKTDQQALALMRAVKEKQVIYSTLSARAQQLQLIKAGTVGDVQELSLATLPDKPLPLHRSFILLAAVMAGLILSSMILLARFLLFSSIIDPDELEQQLNKPVQAVVPFSKQQDAEAKKAQKNKTGVPILSLTNPKDPAIESLRSLRTALSLQLPDRTNNIINIAGTSPGVGKSFISLNMAIVMAEAGKKVLLIDADMRRGKLHRQFGLSRAQGLSAYLQDCLPPESVIQTVQPNVDFLGCGKYPKNPVSLLSSPHFQTLMDYGQTHYDYVVVDTPPIMAVSDLMVIGQNRGYNLMLVGLGKNDLKEISVAIKRIEKVELKIDGLICNYFSKSAQHYSSYGYNYYYYAYDYRNKKGE